MANEEKLPPEEELQKEAGRIDPNGPPQPATGPNWVRGAVTAVGCLTVGGILFAVSGLTPGRTAGATRSSKLKWEERDRQIEAAYQKDQAKVEGEPAGSNEKDAVHE